MELWDRFMLTGSISDYLRYRQALEDNGNDNAEGSDNKRGAERGEQ
ncbi:MAG: hypothetical protein IKP95_10200 [Ruminococcus sp.]|nr:hypothetical protein [Ruminococcus sp.]